jgi:hypothetical protein
MCLKILKKNSDASQSFSWAIYISTKFCLKTLFLNDFLWLQQDPVLSECIFAQFPTYLLKMILKTIIILNIN